MKHNRITTISTIFLLALFASPFYVGGLTTTVSTLGNVSHARISLTKVQVSSSMVLPDTVPFCSNHGHLMCYTPQDIKKAYNYPSNLDGSGQTIVIVDAFGSPTVASDLSTFDAIFGLPAPPSFTILCPTGGCPTVDLNNGNQVGWTSEIALDTQWAHAMAPGANIVLAVSSSDDNNAINAALQNAVNLYPGSIISQSFGTPEGVMNLTPGSADRAFLAQAESIYKQAALRGDTVFASSGDWGADFSSIVPSLNFANAGYPASSPWVTGVGGTQGNPYYRFAPSDTPSFPLCHTTSCSTGLVTFDNSTGTCTRATSSLHLPFCTPTGYGGEQVWNEPWAASATGGAPSLVFDTPSYQKGLGLSSRTVPDVSYDAAISGGVLAVWGVGGGIYVFGGTSAGSPQWSGIAALANQLDQKQQGQNLGFINTFLYRIGHNSNAYQKDFHDITIGNNLVAGGTVGFSAHSGYDYATGLGTPNVGNLVQGLVQQSQNAQGNQNGQ
jgi:subtilase family serine protease